MILLNPGPVNVSPRVRQALMKPDICHRESDFIELMQGIRDKLLRTIRCTVSDQAVPDRLTRPGGRPPIGSG